ncbi:1-phosphofructokinase family hexose kinase [Ruixingdingia sedimenti]|uniref:Phosphofructokinase n=1 Tax=Ruixingdingia sedimenti TaxID=3073604 RepID=A0ABU1FA33_9RHOB|nr:hexose kinase [Xinfangfangia sp. LG-4]MDR5653736.1 hexose kinase [Xinfangfangia sp. LG-4]
MPAQAPILTVTLNPALDLSAHVGRVEAGPKLRLSAPQVDPGGGGVNVARAAGILGGQARALVALGGAVGAQLAARLREAGVEVLPLDAPGETRQSLSVTETATGRQFRFVLPGAEWDAGTTGAALAAIARAATPDTLVVLSGSQPPGVGPDFPARLARALPQGARLVIDTSGPAFDRLLHAPDPGARPAVLRMDQAEAEGAAGRPLPRAADTAAFAAGLVAAGVAEMAVAARGADGSVLAAPGLRLHCIPPEVPVNSKVGAGDSFTGAFTLALARGEGAEAALRLGTAAAAAAVMTPGTELCRRADVERLAPACRMERL